MARIAFIAPDKQLFLQGNKVIADMGLTEQVSLYLGRLKRGIRIAKKLERQDVDVIICRGGTAHLIIQSRVRIPVVEIAITGQDLAQVFHEAKKLTGLARPRVAMLAFENMGHDIETLSQILGIELRVYPLQSTADIPRRIEEVKKDTTDLVVGGIKTVLLAAKEGLRTHLIRSGEFSIRAAFLEAKKIALARTIEKEHSQTFKALADYSLEGIIVINRQKRIDVFNPVAGHLLEISAEQALGHSIETLFPQLDLDSCFTKQQPLIGHTLRCGSRWLTLNLAPIIVDNQVSGCIITFQDISRIQELEAKIRNDVVARQFVAKYHFPHILGESPEIQECKRMAKEIAQVDATVLITGESGTGKELFAQSIHNASKRSTGPFVAVNCAALPANLLESELFGYVEGAFTGATKKGKAGLFELAHRGTLFLDEISEMDPYAQSRLLRVLQERQVMRLGDDKYISVDVRIIAATNKPLKALTQSGSFRQDLFYRLKVLTLTLPPLRRRTQDVPLLAEHFFSLFQERHHKRLSIHPSVYAYLEQYPWPGNVRELRCFAERLTIIAKEASLDIPTVEQYWDDRDESELPAAPPPLAEKERILQALRHCQDNISRTASLLGIDRSTLYRKLRQHQIEVRKGPRA